ncbi:hypothetical protein KFE25_010973 [Diacronema lutheri]|uniref:PHD-type domain-containing protein n=1 Tax=Diacronema lutheri TaxID=2081491 RepID=A0A8J6C459_DIALT|nr:hypothetical protein KFE25_010973 [Diacronema lutheri]
MGPNEHAKHATSTPVGSASLPQCAGQAPELHGTRQAGSTPPLGGADGARSNEQQADRDAEGACGEQETRAHRGLVLPLDACAAPCAQAMSVVLDGPAITGSAAARTDAPLRMDGASTAAPSGAAAARADAAAPAGEPSPARAKATAKRTKGETEGDAEDNWDPPCAKCGSVPTDSRNIVCDGCASVFHWACLRPPLHALPARGAEWFCAACLRRGIIETVLERHGHGPDAWYLVKFRARQSALVAPAPAAAKPARARASVARRAAPRAPAATAAAKAAGGSGGRSGYDVRWLSAAELDISAWAREQMAAFCEREARARALVCPLPLPHPLGGADAQLVEQRARTAAELAAAEARSLRLLLCDDAAREPRPLAPGAAQLRAHARDACCRRLRWWAHHLPPRACASARAEAHAGAGAAAAAAAAGGAQAAQAEATRAVLRAAGSQRTRSQPTAATGTGADVSAPVAAADGADGAATPGAAAQAAARKRPRRSPGLLGARTHLARTLFCRERAAAMRRTSAGSALSSAEVTNAVRAQWAALAEPRRERYRKRAVLLAAGARAATAGDKSDADGGQTVGVAHDASAHTEAATLVSPRAAPSSAQRAAAAVSLRRTAANATAAKRRRDEAEEAAEAHGARARGAAAARHASSAAAAPPAAKSTANPTPNPTPNPAANPTANPTTKLSGAALRAMARAPFRCALCLHAERRPTAECARCGALCHLACVHPPLAEPPAAAWLCPLCAPPVAAAPHPLALGSGARGAAAPAATNALGTGLSARAVADAAAGALELFERGIVIRQTGLATAQVLRCVDVCIARFESAMRRISALDLDEELRAGGFDAIKLRHHGRYDVAVPELASRPFRFTRDEAPWMAIVRAALGLDATLVHCGCMLSLPGSSAQPWHSDGDHLSEERHFAPHCVNVFVPLVQLSRENGPTEFVPHSHASWHAAEPSIVPCIAGGGYIVFDYRLRHRGLANRSAEPRPLLYLTYAKPFFADMTNFSATRYPPLPEVAEWHGREERARARAACA